MAVGQDANVGFGSYLMVGREKTFKTYDTCTSSLDFLSASLKTTKEQKVLETISGNRTYADRISLGKVVEGDIEYYMAADSDAAVYFLHNALGGGTVSSATGTGDTTGAGVFEHTFSINNFDVTYSSLCLNHRKGGSTGGKIYEYSGVRVNEFKLSGEIDEALKAVASVIAVDSSQTSNDVSGNISNIGQTPLAFTGMRLSVESTFASLTASSFWHVQSFEFGVSNSLKADSDSRQIGSDLLDVLPAGIAQFDFNFEMRFDTLTAYNAMLNETQLSAQLAFVGATYTGSKLPQKILINMPRIYISDAGDPEVGGPDEILKSAITATVLRDDQTTSGYAVKAIVTNKTTSYN